MTRYLLDTNIFIQAKNLHYGFDFCPAFWEWLMAHALVHDFVVVIHEVPSDSTRKIKIPNACIGLGLSCVSPYEMLQQTFETLEAKAAAPQDAEVA